MTEIVKNIGKQRDYAFKYLTVSFPLLLITLHYWAKLLSLATQNIRVMRHYWCHPSGAYAWGIGKRVWIPKTYFGLGSFSGRAPWEASCWLLTEQFQPPGNTRLQRVWAWYPAQKCPSLPLRHCEFCPLCLGSKHRSGQTFLHAFQGETELPTPLLS